MLKKLILAVALVAAAALPAQAGDRDRDHRHDRHHHDRHHHRQNHRIEHWHGHHGHVGHPIYYRRHVSQCFWQGGYWASQPILGAAGVYFYQSVWVPAQYVCY